MLKSMIRGVAQLPRSNVLSIAVCRSFTDISLNLDKDTKVAVLSMNKKPVNSLSLETLNEMSQALKQAEADPNTEGLILTSSLPRVFSAGLDILEMYKPEEDRLRRFWRELQEVYLTLYGSRLSTIAAVNGNSPAGGCLLAMSCDYRIMAEGKFSIGLNETKLGIVAPFWFQATMERLVGHRETETALMLGHMYSTEEALAKGLVDRLVPEDKVMAEAAAEMQRWMKIPAAARTITKQQLRKGTLEKLREVRETDIDYFVNYVTGAGVQDHLGMYMQMLKAKAGKK